MTDKFDDYINAVLEESKPLAKSIFNGLERQALDDAGAFAKKAENDLRRWTKQLSEKQITVQDFSDLVLAKKSLAEIHALTQSGVSIIKLEKFRSGLINLAIDKASVIFL